MSDIAMASSPNTPTARKGPVTSSPSSKGSAKAQQQRRASTSQATPKAQQQRKNSNPQASPKFVSQQRRQSAAAEGSTLVGNKRKAKDEEQSPTKVDLQVNARGAYTVIAQPDAISEPPPKKQKTVEMNTEIGSAQQPATTTLSQPPSVALISQTTLLLRHILVTHPSLLPPSPSPIISSHIDDTTHTMWQVAFNHGPMLARACQYSAMFSPLKLAALAKLNFLPSWWFLREFVVKEIGGEVGGIVRVIDDGEMQVAWKEAVTWCIRVLGNKGGVKGDVGELK